MIFLNWCVAFW